MAARRTVNSITIDEYLAALGGDERAALGALRKTIRAAAPKAEECISYGLAAFRQEGMLVGFGASAKHCALYLMDDTTVAAHSALLRNYDTSKGAIRFRADKPLPAALVRRLVKARLAENLANRPVKEPRAKGSRSDPAVIKFMDSLDHPMKEELAELRRLILSASTRICEGIKWNSPSFRTTDWFATVNVHGKNSLRLILHRGAKVKASATKGFTIADPAGILKWLGKDRGLVTIGGGKDFQSKRGALKEIVREWIRFV